MRVFVLTIFLMTLLLSSCGSKSRSHRKIPLKVLEVDNTIKIDTTRAKPVDGTLSEE